MLLGASWHCLSSAVSAVCLRLSSDIWCRTVLSVSLVISGKSIARSLWTSSFLIAVSSMFQVIVLSPYFCGICIPAFSQAVSSLQHSTFTASPRRSCNAALQHTSAQLGHLLRHLVLVAGHLSRSRCCSSHQVLSSHDNS